MKSPGASPKSSAPPPWAFRGKALVVDEYPEDVHFYATVLEAYGYEVRRCTSYLEGVRCLGEEVFDFVIVSQGSHNFEGSWVLMRAIEVNPSLPVLVVARFLDMDSYLEAIQLGAIDHLIEPLTVWEIGRLLETHSRVERRRYGSGMASGRTGWEGRNSGQADAAEAVMDPVAASPAMR